MSHLIALTLMLTFFDVSMFVNVLTKNNYMPKQRIAHFSSGSTFANFNENEDGSITKRALILCSGEHTDSKGRKHYFDDDYIFTVAENTNLEFNSGANIPVLKEHNKHVDSIVGSLESTVEARVITEEDLPDPRQKHLLGRVGLFAQNVLIKANDAVEKVKQGLARTISAGLDLKDKKIREISLVSIPAIKGMALYSMMDKGDNGKPMTFEEMEAYEKDEEGLKEEYEEYAEMLYKVLCNIKCCEDMTVSGEQQSELIQQAFLDFSERVSDLMFGDMNEISADDDEPNNPYSMIPGGNTMSPYSMFTEDDAEFGANPLQSRIGYVKGDINPNKRTTSQKLRDVGIVGGLMGGITGGTLYGTAKLLDSKIGRKYLTKNYPHKLSLNKKGIATVLGTTLLGGYTATKAIDKYRKHTQKNRKRGQRLHTIEYI